MDPTTPRANKASSPIRIWVRTPRIHALVLFLIRLHAVILEYFSKTEPDISAGVKPVSDSTCGSVETDLKVNVPTYSDPRLIVGVHPRKVFRIPVLGGSLKVVEQELEIHFKVIPLVVC